MSRYALLLGRITDTSALEIHLHCDLTTLFILLKNLVFEVRTKIKLVEDFLGFYF